MKPIHRLRKFGTSAPHIFPKDRPTVQRDGKAVLEAEAADALGTQGYIGADDPMYSAFLLAMAFHPDAPNWLKEHPFFLLERGSPSLYFPGDIPRFVEYVSSFRGMGRRVRRFVSQWYNQ